MMKEILYQKITENKIMKTKEIIQNTLFVIFLMVGLWSILWVGAIAQGNV